MKIRLLFTIFLLAACATPPAAPNITISVVADGLNSSYKYNEPITVDEFLRDIDLQLGDLDDINPPIYTQISDKMVITVVRIQEEETCEKRDVPYQRISRVDERLAPDSQGELIQSGVPGREEVCYRVQIRNGVRQQPEQIGSPVRLTEPQPEIVAMPPPSSLEPIEIIGTLAYVSKGNAWVMRGSSQAPDKRRLATNTGDLDARFVFSLSADGRQLLYTRKLNTDEFGNELWLLPDVYADQPQPVKLRPTDVLDADWVPGSANTISYSRAESRAAPPGWRARNDLWLSVIDPQTGDEISIDPLIEETAGGGGPYGWWGTEFYWSLDGQNLAWVHADAVGTVNLQTGELTPLITYEEFTPNSNWSWRTSVSWSPDSRLIVTTTHPEPENSTTPRGRSPVFNVTFASVDGPIKADIVERVGIWSNPQFSPFIKPNDSPFDKGYLAYLVARQPLDSVSDNAEYDLYVADRDGSNARRLFPEEGERGLLARDYTWSPDGQQIALVYGGNLWVVDAATGLANQVTLDGSDSDPVSNPVWME